jgi:hypothetical protein
MNTQNPNQLVDRYLQAIRFWMPKTKRQQGLIAELGEDLRSQVEEKEAELGRPLAEDEVAAILKRCGSPMAVAGSLGPRRHLIGPALYPIYAFVLKMVLLWILLPVFVFIIGPLNVANGDWPSAIGGTIVQMMSGMLIAAGIITIVFAAVERTANLDLPGSREYSGVSETWDPRKLPQLRTADPAFSPFKSFCETMFGCIGLCWILLLPHYPALILGPAARILKAAPIWHQFYLPLVFLGVLGVLRPAITMSRPAWRAFPLWSHLLQTVLTLLFLCALANAAHLPNGAWQPFIVPVEGMTASPSLIQAAGFVNMSLLICVAGTALGLCIAGVIQAWQLVKHFRKRSLFGAHSASQLT